MDDAPAYAYRVFHKSGKQVSGNGSLTSSGKLYLRKAGAKGALTKAVAGGEYASRTRYMREHNYRYDDMYKPSVMADYAKVRAEEAEAAQKDYYVVEYLLQPISQYTPEEFKEI